MKAFRLIHDRDQYSMAQCLSCKDWVPHIEGSRYCALCGCKWEVGLISRPSSFPRWAWNRGIREWVKLPPRDTSRLHGYRLQGSLWHRETGEPWGGGWSETTWNDDLHVVRQGSLTDIRRLWSAFQWRLAELHESAEFLMDHYELRVRLLETPSRRVLWTKTYR